MVIDEPRGAALERLFVAVPVPEELFSFVRSAQALLPPISGLRLMREDQFHVTLAFIGEVGPEKAQAAREVVRSVSEDMGGTAQLGGFLYFPSSARARVVALGISDPHKIFVELFELVMSGLEKARVMKREKRPFKPHLTIARLKVPGMVKPKSDSGQQVFAVQSICLFRSELRRDGAVYTVLEQVPLMGAAQ